MSVSRRTQVLEALIARVAAIRRSGDFNTDAGADVFLGETPELTEADPKEAIAIVPGDDAPRKQGGIAFIIDWPIEIQAVIGVDEPDVESWTLLEGMIADVKTAVELESDVNRNLDGICAGQFERGATRTLARETGSRTFGLSITYTFQIKEAWGGG